MDTKTFTITQYNTAIHRRLSDVPPVWIQGVITQLRVRDPMVYLTLAEFAEGEERPVATIELNCWSKEWYQINSRLTHLSRPIQIAVDLKVSLLVKADFYVPWGKFQAKILDINPEFTLGELALTREKILADLRKDGLLDLNRQLPLPRPALRIAVISAPSSAAYADFCDLLNHSPFAFKIHLFPAKMQGDKCANSILSAMSHVDCTEFDVLCVIRGGGAKTDLVYFDNEDLCRAVAKFPLPVITGIGHQIDLSLVDLVAWQNRITPTDCARFLLNRVEECYEVLLQYSIQLQQIVRTTIGQKQLFLTELSQKFQTIWRQKLESENFILLQFKNTLGYKITSRMQLECHKIAMLESELQYKNPKTLLSQGWSLTLSGVSQKKLDPHKLKIGDEIINLIADYKIESKVLRISKK